MFEICEVGVRDGLQNEKLVVSTEDKLELIRQLVAAGTKKIEVASFVNPKLMPQMADAEILIEQLVDVEGVTYSALVLSNSGLERLLATKINAVQLSFAVSDGFNMKNIRRTTDESIVEMKKIVDKAKDRDKKINVILGTVFGCPYDGKVELGQVMKIAREFVEVGVDEITFADTVGLANPNAITQAVQLFQAEHGDFPLGLHLHNTRGSGIANALAGLQNGITRFDSSIGGIGGCPFAPKAVGNICTEDFVYMLHEMGYETGLDLERYVDTAKWLEGKLNRTIEGMLMKTM